MPFHRTSPQLLLLKKAGLALIIGGLTISSVQAQIGVVQEPKQAEQSGPSLEATQNWLVEKANAVRQATETFREMYRLSFSNCAMTYIETAYSPGPINDSHAINDLAELNGERISLYKDYRSERWLLVLPTLGGRAIVNYTQNPAPGGGVYRRSDDDIRIYFEDREMAERAKNAFQHAIRLCVKQRADKKAAEPARPKEIF
ncbi:hypothetical protein [Herbaspirillum frisingense]|uniref:hypothetical protein n=1 Tax=Herbaspirillum frisingense TaxID=92645 RepID=UPI001F1680EA|nr:hypothetical protein [Herbaspirillum frisingense]UIN20316.1 hypothetical protein LAZ82_17780 [Herbaspirillum frisingense]